MAAASVLVIDTNGRTGYAFETITVSTTGIGITITLLTQTPTTNGALDTKRHAQAALLSVVTDAIRIRLDGTDPTAAVGHLITAGDYVLIEGEDALRKLRMIRVTTDATVSVSLFR
jgi:hypothetical protein